MAYILGKLVLAFFDYSPSCCLTGRNTVIRSICPQLYGLCAVKLAGNCCFTSPQVGFVVLISENLLSALV